MHRRDVPHHLVRGPGGEGLNRKLKDNSIVGAEQEQIQNFSLFFVDKARKEMGEILPQMMKFSPVKMIG